jgi:flagellar hook-associated protein 1
MGNTLGVAVSGLVSLQRAIATAGNNIVNVNTEGYNRQTVELVSQPSTLTGAGFIGNGVKTSGIKRVYNEFLVSQVREYSSSSATLRTKADLSARLDNLLADPSAGLTANLQKLFAAIQSVANNPASLPERQVMLSEGKGLANQVQFLDSSLDGLNSEVNSRMGAVVEEINILANNLARANERIANIGEIGTGQIPNDLYDLRDQLLVDLSSKVNIRTIDQNDGNITVLIGNGQPLVVGSQMTELKVLTNDFDASRAEIGYVSNAQTGTPITSLVTGGELEGLISFRDQILDPARNQLGLVVTGLSESFNAQHKLGLDARGLQGQNFFKSAQPAVVARTLNAGTATVSASITDISQLQASDYLLRYDGTDWQVIRKSDNQSTTGSSPISLDGLDITMTAGAVAGDSFLIRPVFAAASEFGIEIRQPAQIAAAAALISENLVSNAGDAELSGLKVAAQAGIPISGNITLTFNPDALGAGVPGFDVTGGPATPIAYDPLLDSPGKIFNFPGSGDLSFSMSGVPSAGDRFIIENNQGGIGDNRNVLLLAELQSTRVLQDNQATFQDVYGNLVAEIAVKSRQTEVNLDTETTLLAQAKGARDSVSGVNLDEEAADLLRFQQAYQAAAQMVSVAQSLFQTLLNASSGR